MQMEDDGLWLDPYSDWETEQALQFKRNQQAAVRRAEPTKQCRKCGTVWPRDAQHYYRDRDRRDGLRVVCKVCESQRTPREERPGYKRCARCKEWLPASWEYFHEQRGGRNAWCIECHRKYNHERRKQNYTC